MKKRGMWRERGIDSRGARGVREQNGVRARLASDGGQTDLEKCPELLNILAHSACCIVLVACTVLKLTT